jgi:multiple antibiotic resistance protein
VHNFIDSVGEMYGELFPIVSPLSVIPIFIALTAGRPMPDRMRLALKSAFFVFVILFVFLFVGEPLLHHFGISIEALQIAGGIIVGLTGLRMVLADVPDPADMDERHATRDSSFSPLAMPLLAGPGALGALMAIEARRKSDAALPGFIVGIVLIAVTVYVCLALSTQIARVIGAAGVDAVNRIFGLLVMAIGVEMVVHGINQHEAFRH